jgi:hypothetical protein
MTDTGSSRLDQGTSQPAYGPVRKESGWTGWVRFAAFLMLLNGFIQALEGFIALVNPDHYHVNSSGLAVAIPYTGWGWVHLIIGVALFASGMGVLSGNLLARFVGVALAGLNALTALVFIEAAPAWGIILVTVDVLVIYALTVHGSELREF